MIECPTCGFDNPTDSSHCERCGRPLAGIKPSDDGEPDGQQEDERASDEASEGQPDAGRGRRGRRKGRGPSTAPDLQKAGKVESDNALGDVDRIAIKLTGIAQPRLGGEPGAAGILSASGAHAHAHDVDLRVRDQSKRRTFHEGLPAVIALPPHEVWPMPADVPVASTPPAEPPPATRKRDRATPGGLKVPPAVGATGELAPAEPKPESHRSSHRAAETQALPVVNLPLYGSGPASMPLLPPYSASAPVTIRRRADSGAAFFGGVFVAMLFVGGVFAVHQLAQQGLEADAAVEVASPPHRVPIAAGPFFRGLSNDFRVMFSNTCPRLADNPSVDCKEDVGLRDEIPMSTVELPAYAMDSHEVSNGQWQACVDAGGCAAIDWSSCENRTTQGYTPFLRVPKELRAPDRPAICVTKAEASAFCTWAGGRLPGADEWEKAARGVDGYLFPWGSDWSAELANWGELDVARTNVAGKLDGFVDTAPPGSFTEGKSPFGCYDMAGNVAEWVHRKEDTKIEATARGGSWLSTPADLRATRRLFVKPDSRRTDIGFRCAAHP